MSSDLAFKKMNPASSPDSCIDLLYCFVLIATLIAIVSESHLLTRVDKIEAMPATMCRSCRLHLRQSVQARAFSSTTQRTSISPESPRFIDVPKSFQEDWAPPRFVSGRMPVPRDLFPARRPDKPSPEYLANVTQDPKVPVDVSKLSEKQQYKHRLSQMRKEYLREGLTGLNQRKKNAIQNMQFRSDEKQAERSRLLSQAEREDARLTNISVTSEMNPDKKVDLAHLNAQEIHEHKITNVARKEAERTALRKDQLHTLYMNSREFITTQEQLKKKIADEFSATKFGGEGRENYASHWEAGEVPEGINDLVNAATVSSTGARNDPGPEAAFKRDQERMKRIAEKLSGGKI